jgi:hypothetical protein
VFGAYASTVDMVGNNFYFHKFGQGVAGGDSINIYLPEGSGIYRYDSTSKAYTKVV